MCGPQGPYILRARVLLPADVVRRIERLSPREVHEIMRKSSLSITPESITAKVEQLCRYAASLNRTIDKLSDRIRPLSGDQVGATQWRSERIYLPPQKPTLDSIAISVAVIAKCIQSMESDTGHMRSNLDQISNSACSRQELMLRMNPGKGHTR
jgi:hypothetical protein